MARTADPYKSPYINFGLQQIELTIPKRTGKALRSEDWSLARIADLLNEAGHRTPKRKLYTPHHGLAASDDGGGRCR